MNLHNDALDHIKNTLRSVEEADLVQTSQDDGNIARVGPVIWPGNIRFWKAGTHFVILESFCLVSFFHYRESQSLYYIFRFSCWFLCLRSRKRKYVWLGIYGYKPDQYPHSTFSLVFPHPLSFTQLENNNSMMIWPWEWRSRITQPLIAYLLFAIVAFFKSPLPVNNFHIFVHF